MQKSVRSMMHSPTVTPLHVGAAENVPNEAEEAPQKTSEKDMGEFLVVSASERAKFAFAKQSKKGPFMIMVALPNDVL